MAKTAEKLMDLAQDYIQTRGYNAFSYKDLARDLGIKTSSIHYHFPKKADLGEAIVQRYMNEFKKLYGANVPDDGNRLEQFNTYLDPFIATSDTQVKICLCGALGGEYAQALQLSAPKLPSKSEEPGITRRRQGSRRSGSNPGESAFSQPGMTAGS